MTITIAYSDAYLEWKGSAASPVRAYLATEMIRERAWNDMVAVHGIDPTNNTIEWGDAIYEDLLTIHDQSYVDRVYAGEDSHAPDATQAETARTMFEGTRVLVDAIEADEFKTGVYFNPQGAKHHAAYDHSSGFCVFNDMAWAAKHWSAQGKRVAYIDWDVHHGDGVEDLTRNDRNILTASIHQRGIFPGTGLRSNKDKRVFNYPLTAGAGDSELWSRVIEARDRMEQFKPDVILVGAGADGHISDPLAQLRYSVEGIAAVGGLIGDLANVLNVPLLVGGAGGYQPFTYTPLIWSETIRSMHRALDVTM